MTPDPLKYPDVLLVLMIAMLTPIIARPTVVVLCLRRLSSPPRDVMDALKKESTWLLLVTLSLTLNQDVRPWILTILIKSTLRQNQLLLLILRSKISAGEIVGRYGGVLWVFHFHSYLNIQQGALEGRIEASTVSWTGEGTWMPESICYDWSKETNKVFICTFPDGTSLTNGQSASGSCGVGAGLECP